MYQSIVSEPFLESVPQLHLLFVIGMLSYVSGGGKVDSDSIENYSGDIIIPTDLLFWATFLLSFAASTFGIVKFIKSGPAGIVRNDKWLDGFGTLTFILLFANVASTMIVKGIVMSISIVYLVDSGERGHISNDPLYLAPCLGLFILAFLPQCLHVSS